MTFRHWPLAGLLTLALWGCGSTPDSAAPQPTPDEPTDRLFTLDYRQLTLDNGLTLVMVPTAYPDVVAMEMTVGTGSRNEVEPGKTGFAHFFEHMMFKGTETHPQAVYQAMLKERGVDNRAYTTDDYTNYHQVFAKDHLETMLALEADRFQNLSYDESTFRTEALTVKGEYLKNFASPVNKLYAGLRERAYVRHTYRHSTMGFFEDIEAMPDQLDYAELFFERYYKPEYVTLTLVGDFDPDQAEAWVKRYWGEWAQGDYQVTVPAEPTQVAAKYDHLQEASGGQYWYAIGFHGPAFSDRTTEFAAVALLGEQFFGPNSALYQQLVVNEQVANQMFHYFPQRTDPGQLMLFFRSGSEADLLRVREALVETLAQLRTQPMDEADLERLKSHLKYRFANGLDSSKAIADVLATYLHFDRDLETLNRYYAQLDRVTPAEIQAAANRFFIESGSTGLTLGSGPELPGFDAPLGLEARVAALGEAPEVGFAVLDQRSASPIIDLNLLFHTGAAWDPAEAKGLAQFTARMLVDAGSAQRSYRDLEQANYPLGGSLSVQVDKEMVSVRGRVHKDNFDAWYPLFAERVLSPGWREEDINRLRTELVNAIQSGLKAANDEELGKEALYQQIYQGHPYQSLNLGRVSHLEGITPAQLETFYRDHFTQANLTLGVAGDLSDAQLARLKADLAALPGEGAQQPAIKAPAPLAGRQALVISKPETKATAVSFGFPITLNRADSDWVALWLVRSYLGEHRSANSFLYQRIRELRGMNYGDYAYIEYFPRGMFQTRPDANLGRSSQIFQVWLRPLRDNQDAHFATRVAMHELEKLVSEGMSGEAFEATRNFLTNAAPQLVASQDRLLGYALDSAYYGTDAFVETVRAGLASLTLEQVNRVIREQLVLDNIQFVFVSPEANKMAERLRSERPSPMRYNTEMPEPVQAEDARIQALPLGIRRVEVVPLEGLFQ
ncbi:M16 family metallopeptidase [Ferrimonas balearica]|uniref:M16 family metallopeptidase n=1 Tax=Ferrimonas balearica TaxID=44012 RepID=UPI001C998DA8|nr:pitrilysin family protein [Ferrimonas balearica]MBY5990624.1 insulinase family protein [Ferrimonas balearica]